MILRARLAFLTVPVVVACLACGTGSSPLGDVALSDATLSSRGAKKTHGDAGASTPSLSVTYFGAAGTFGAPWSTLPTGQPVELVAVPGWQAEPGQAFWFPSTTSDGTLFVANLPQTFNEFIRTACDMAITCFNPTEPTCQGPDGGPAYFANLEIPTEVGNLLWGGATSCPETTSDAGQAFGPDIGDVWTVNDPVLGERVYFISDDASAGLGSTPATTYPALGAITKASGLWAIDPSLSVFNAQLASSDAGSEACAYDPDAGLNSCGGFNEFQELPRSHRFAIAQYFGGGPTPDSSVAIVDLAGNVLASFGFPVVANPCTPSENLALSAREVEVDPSSALGDERFAISFDVYTDPRGGSTIEFSYDDTTQTLTQVTAPFLPTSADYPASTCAGPVFGGSAHYDPQGNLWMARLNGRTLAGPIDLYPKNPTTGKRPTETLCGANDPTTHQPRPWGFPCPSTLEVGPPKALPDGGNSWSLPFLTEAATDPVTNSFIYSTVNGDLASVEELPINGGAVFVSKMPVNLGLSHLPADPNTSVSSQRPALDLLNRQILVPVATGESSCGFFCGGNTVGAVRPNYVAAVSLDGFLNVSPNILSVDAPASAPSKTAISISFTSDLSPADAVREEFLFEVFEGTSLTKEATANLRASCRSGTCRWTATIPARDVTAQTTSVSWHAFLIPASATTLGTHVAGMIDIP